LWVEGAQTDSDQLLSPHDQAELAGVRKRLFRLETALQRQLDNVTTLALL
jgi:hypothetical protein